MIKKKHQIKIVIITVLVGVGILSYEEESSIPKHNIQARVKVKIPVKTLDHKVLPERLLTLTSKPNTHIDQGNIQANLFGKFFYDRAEFYIIKNPQNKIHSSPTESITLFYLDGKLGRTKYVLKKNIAIDLIKAYSGFTIKGFDTKNRNLISSGNAMIKAKNGLHLNKKLDNYRLSWSIGNKEIMYRVHDVDSLKSFEYTEKSKEYEKFFKAIEISSF